MYLIRVECDRRLPEVRAAIADCEKMHILISRLFGSDRASSQVLFRSDLKADCLRLYIYSSVPINENDISRYRVTQRDITPLLSNLTEGRILGFDLVASPSKKVEQEGKKNSRRIILRTAEERNDWLERKSAQSGFELLNASEQEQIHISGNHRESAGGRMYLDAYHYQGTLRITNGELFQKALQNGIGSGKAYGFGMLLLK